MASRDTEKRLEAIENNKYLRAVQWVEQNPELFMQFLGVIAACEQIGLNPLEVLNKLNARVDALQKSNAKFTSVGALFNDDAVTSYKPIFTHEERRRRIIELLYTAKERRDEAMGEGGV